MFLNLYNSLPLSVKPGYSVPQDPKILYNEDVKNQEEFWGSQIGHAAHLQTSIKQIIRKEESQYNITFKNKEPVICSQEWYKFYECTLMGFALIDHFSEVKEDPKQTGVG